MSELEYPKSNDQWARQKGIKRHCKTCRKDYDPHLLDPEYGECPDCYKKRLELEEQKRKRKELWDSIIWPEK